MVADAIVMDLSFHMWQYSILVVTLTLTQICVNININDLSVVGKPQFRPSLHQLFLKYEKTVKQSSWFNSHTSRNTQLSALLSMFTQLEKLLKLVK